MASVCPNAILGDRSPKKPELARLLCEYTRGADAEWIVDKCNPVASIVARLGGLSAPRFPPRVVASCIPCMRQGARDRPHSRRRPERTRADHRVHLGIHIRTVAAPFRSIVQQHTATWTSIIAPQLSALCFIILTVLSILHNSHCS